MNKKTLLIGSGVFAVLALAARLTLTLFVVQPLGAVPDGRTLVMWRTGSLKFIDSADAVCERTSGGVSLFCRIGVLGQIGKDADSRILLRLPYSRLLYLASTGGAEYNR